MVSHPPEMSAHVSPSSSPRGRSGWRVRVSHLLALIFQHRVLIALLLYVFTWASGGGTLYIIGLIFHGDRTIHDDAGHYIAHNWSLLNCLYMAAITLTTVGFEVAVDVQSLDESGAYVGIAFLTVYTLTSYLVALASSAAIISFFLEGSLFRFFKRIRMDKQLSNLSEHFIVCGCGTTGIHIVEELRKTGRHVVAIDKSEANIGHVLAHHHGVLAVKGDALDDEVLQKARIDSARGLFAVLAEDRDNILLTVSARQLQTRLRIVSRATNYENISKFRRVGANAVISPNHIGGLRMASEMVRPKVVDFLDTMVRDHTQVARFEHVIVRDGGKAAGKKLEALGIFRHVGLAVIGVVRTDGKVQYNPGGSTVVNAGDALVVVADEQRLKALEELLN